MAFRRGPMAAGERDRIVRLQQRPVSPTASTSRLPVETWTTLVADMPASRLDTAGMERFASGQNSARVDTRWEINYRTDMDPELLDVPKLRRIVSNGRIHNIVTASVIGRRNGIELLTIASSEVLA